MMHTPFPSVSLQLILALATLRAQPATDSASVAAFYQRWMGSASQPKSGGDPAPFETKYVDLLHRTAGGWEVAFRMWSDNR